MKIPKPRPTKRREAGGEGLEGLSRQGLLKGTFLCNPPITPLRSKVYEPWPHTLDELEVNITRVVNQMDPAMLTRALGDMKKRAQLCLAANGGNFEK